MAREVETIYNEMITEKESLSSLSTLTPTPETYTEITSDLSSSSKVAIWRLMIWVVAQSIAFLEGLWDTFEANILTSIANQKFGSLRWYVSVSKEYQHGDALVDVNGFPGYSVIDTTKQIITQAAAFEGSGIVFVKVAKDDGSGGLEALTSPELSGFESYINKRKVAGVQLVASSFDADDLQLDCVIGYDPIIPLATVQASVEAAVEAYLQALPFDSVFKRLALEDALQGLDGVETIDITSMVGVQGAQTVIIDQEYAARAGYMTLDLGNSNITYNAV